MKPDVTKDYKHLLHCIVCNICTSPSWHKLNAIKTSTINFALIQAYLWKPKLEASGAYPSIKMDTVSLGHSSLRSGQQWVGRKRSRGGWGIHWFIASGCSLLTVASAAGAAMEPLGETKTTLPQCNPHGRTGLEVPHLTPQKQGNERLPVKQIPMLLTPLCLACLEVSEQWVILHTLFLCCRTASTAIKARAKNSDTINNLAFPFLWFVSVNGNLTQFVYDSPKIQHSSLV